MMPSVLRRCNIEQAVKTQISVQIATMKNNESSGCFEDALNRLLKANGLPSFTLGDVTPPTLLPHQGKFN